MKRNWTKINLIVSTILFIALVTYTGMSGQYNYSGFDTAYYNTMVMILGLAFIPYIFSLIGFFAKSRVFYSIAMIIYIIYLVFWGTFFFGFLLTIYFYIFLVPVAYLLINIFLNYKSITETKKMESQSNGKLPMEDTDE